MGPKRRCAGRADPEHQPKETERRRGPQPRTISCFRRSTAKAACSAWKQAWMNGNAYWVPAAGVSNGLDEGKSDMCVCV